eukprot:jgi/Chrzof1/12236/Cz06g26170.t1
MVFFCDPNRPHIVVVLSDLAAMAATLLHMRCSPALAARQQRTCGASKQVTPFASTASIRPYTIRRTIQPLRAIELDFSDPDTQVSVAGVVLGLLFGLGAPWFYISRAERDEERLEELRAINRATYEETGEYMSEVRGAARVVHRTLMQLPLTMVALVRVFAHLRKPHPSPVGTHCSAWVVAAF